MTEDESAMTNDEQFRRANRAVIQAAAAIERAVERLLDKTDPLDCVARDYVVERLMDVLVTEYPEAVAYLNRLLGAGTMQLTNAAMDWRDNRVDR
jgi:hypothetical protein